MRLVAGLETELSHLGLRGKGAVTGSEPSDAGDQMSATQRVADRILGCRLSNPISRYSGGTRIFICSPMRPFGLPGTVVQGRP